MNKGSGYNHDWLLRKGFTINPDGSYSAPPIKSEYIKSIKGEIVVKEEIIKTPDFVVKPVTEWFIPYQIPSKKNSRQSFVSKTTGKMINIPSTSYKNYVTATNKYWQVFSKEFKRSVELLGLSYPLNIEFTFIRKNNQRFDHFGPGESAADLMVDNGFIPDDDTKHLKPFFGDALVDGKNPGLRIKILSHV